MKVTTKKRILVVLGVSILLSAALFLVEYVFQDSGNVVKRNSYGEGEKTEEYEVAVEGEEKKDSMEIVVEEQEYTDAEIQNVFQEVIAKLDEVILGENESFDRVEKNLNLVTKIEGYPVEISWELDSYFVMNMYGEIKESNVAEEGTLVELKGTIRYREKQAIYVQYARVYPLTREGIDKLWYEISQKVSEVESETRQKESFELPDEIDGKKITWDKKKKNNWMYVLVIGLVVAGYLIYNEKESVKVERKKRNDELLREYPGVISKFTMLLSTGATVKNAWEKIVQNYENQKEKMGTRVAYEEMAATLREMQGGISEGEAYERYGKRCEVTEYLKLGALLAQNTKKGSKGLSDMLRVESIQSFENRKSTAKKLGEEAGTKLLMPLFGMLAVVFIIVMVPAFLTMQ